jgi:hypothetical protein
MLRILISALLIWLACIVIGGLLHGLFWLLIIGVVLFIVTGLFGFLKRETLGRGRHRT